MAEINVGTVGYKVTLNANSMLLASQKALADFKKFSSEISTAGKKMEADIEASSRRTKAHFEAQAAAATAAAKSISRDMMLIGAGIAGGLGLAAKQAAEFDQAMRNVNSLVRDTETQFQKTKKAVMGLVDDPLIRQGPKDLAKGMYDVVSSGFTGAKALEILRISAIGAGAGMTDTATASRALMAVLNSGVGGVNSVRGAMDVLFRAVDRGVFTFANLADNLGTILPTAKQMGVRIQEVAAAYATMTKQGLSLAESETALNNLMIHVAKPGKEQKKLMDELGISYGITAMEAKGLGGWLQEVLDKTHGSKQKIIEIIPEIRGMKGELLLLNENLKMYKEELGFANTAQDGVGSTMLAAKEQAKGAVAQWEKMRAELEKLGIEIGNHLLPYVSDIISKMREMVKAFGNQTEALKEGELKFALWTAAIALGVGTVASLIIKLAELKTALSTLALGKWAIPITFTIAYGKMLSDLVTDPALGNQMSAGLGGAGAGSGFAALNERMKSEAARNLADKLARQGMAEGRIATTELLRANAPKSIFERFPPAKAGGGGAKGGGLSDEQKKDLESLLNWTNSAKVELLRLAGEKRQAADLVSLQEFNQSVKDFPARRQLAHDLYIAQLKDHARDEKEELKKLAEDRMNFRETLRARNFQQWDQLLGRENAQGLAGGDAVDNMRAMANFARNFSDALGAIKTDTLKPIMDEARTFFREFNDMFRTPMVGKQEHDFRDPYQTMDQNAEGERNLALQQRIRSEMEKQRDAARKTMEAWAPVREALQRGFENAFADMFKHGLKGFKSFFNSILQSFEQTLAQMAAEWAAQQLIFGAIKLAAFAGFDDPVNDATAGRWGRDFGKHFSMGALESASRMAVAGNGAGPVSTGHTYYNFSFPGDIHIREEADISKLADGLAVEIERRSRVRF